ncbi:MAG TPA: hypothetical protein VGY91_11445 [Chthoniobacterales bacterium]|jgi:hypothetical protein|nr:hypothetical protein [Chthoniobacterales bacterium]
MSEHIDQLSFGFDQESSILTTSGLYSTRESSESFTSSRITIPVQTLKVGPVKQLADAGKVARNPLGPEMPFHPAEPWFQRTDVSTNTPTRGLANATEQRLVTRGE